MTILLALLSVFCATVPMFVFLMAVWWMDRHDREPLWLFGLTFLWGAIGAVFLSLIGNETLMLPLQWALGAEMADQLSAVIIAPLVEEPMKALILFAVMFSRHFDNASDGFVYGAAAGLGFGMTENFLYFVQVASTGDVFTWVQTVVIRTFFSAVMHACATSWVGACLGFARFRGWFAKIPALPVGFGVAMGIHALWNGLLTADGMLGETGTLTTLNLVVFPFEVLVLFGVFQLALWEERATIRRELADEVQQGLLPLAHAKAIASYFQRSRRDWVPAGVPHWHYVRAVTTLALRKHQCRNASSRSYRFYSDEVLRLRREVQGLLALGKRAKAG
ncbi:MAG: PrsW family intramembrane metalloprotease [Myxococcota bacterium]